MKTIEQMDDELDDLRYGTDKYYALAVQRNEVIRERDEAMAVINRALDMFLKDLKREHISDEQKADAVRQIMHEVNNVICWGTDKKSTADYMDKCTELDYALDLLREIVEWVNESCKPWSMPDISKARELLKRKEGQ